MMEDGKRDLDPVDVAVVGAGMAGLSTAVYSRLAGLSVRLFERHSITGGLCTAWKRKGYVFDYCVHWLTGSGPEHGFRGMWEELGVMDGRKFIDHEVFERYVGEDGRAFDFFVDPARLEAEMLRFSPGDAKAASELRKAIDKARKLKTFGFGNTLGSFLKFLSALPAIGVLKDFGGLRVRDWCARLESDPLRRAFQGVWDIQEFPMSALIMTIAMMAEGEAGYPLGGSLPLARAVEARAKSLGADIRCGCGVRRALFEDGRAVGVELEDGRIQRARHVVAACDARSTFDRLLEGRVRDERYEALFAEKRIFPSLIQVSLGILPDPAWGLDSLAPNASYPIARAIDVDGRPRSRIGIHHYAYDPLMAPEGRTVILVRFDGDYDRWKALGAESPAYSAEKERLLAETTRALESVFPGIGARIEVSDVNTPLSCERYTGNWRGCMEGWLLTTSAMKDLISGRKLPKTFPGLDGFYLIGQWTEPGGGLPPAAANGRDVLRMIQA